MNASDRSVRKLARLPRNVWVLTLTSFLTDISSEMVVNLLPLLLVSVLGVRTGVVGLIEGVAETTASLVKLWSGWFSDRTGRRKPLVVLGYGLSAISKPFLYFATRWGTVLAVRFSDRLGKGLRSAPRDAMIADGIQPAQRGLAFGLHRAGDTAGAVVGVSIALAVVVASGQTATLTRETFQRVVLLSLIPAALAVVLVFLGVRERAQARPVGELVKPRLRDLGRPYFLYLATFGLFTLGNSSDAFLILRASSVGLSVVGILAMMLAFNLVYAIVSTPAGAASDRLGRKRLLLSGWLLYALVYLGFARMSAPWQAWLWMMLYGLYYALTEGVSKALIADLVVPDRRGSAYGLYAGVVGMLALPASLLAGVLWQGVGEWAGFGPAAPFLFGAGLSAIAAGLLFLQDLRPRTAT
ncbi:MAG: MFS transporter [Anaerolineales bacterium]|nr:MFS transporter [Anaerolineales bacterium]